MRESEQHNNGFLPNGIRPGLFFFGDNLAGLQIILGLTAPKLKKRLLIDEVIDEPPGGAHRDCPAAINAVGAAMEKALANLERPQTDALLQSRRARWRNYGVYSETRA